MTPLEEEVRRRVRAAMRRELAWHALYALGWVAAGFMLGVAWTRAWVEALLGLAR